MAAAIQPGVPTGNKTANINVYSALWPAMTVWPATFSLAAYLKLTYWRPSGSQLVMTSA